MLIHNPLKYKIRLERPEPLKELEDEKLREFNMLTKTHHIHAQTPKVGGLMQLGQLKLVKVTSETKVFGENLTISPITRTRENFSLPVNIHNL